MAEQELQRSKVSDGDLEFFHSLNKMLVSWCKFGRIAGKGIQVVSVATGTIGATGNIVNGEPKTAAVYMGVFGALALAGKGVESIYKAQQSEWESETIKIEQEQFARTDEKYAELVYGEAAPLVLGLNSNSIRPIEEL